jgi:membrane protein implicated in regulation of membrane protease activity
MVTSMRMWASVAALAGTVSWSPSASYQMLLYLWVCAATVTVVLASLWVNPGFETHSAKGKRSAVGKQRNVSL